MNKELDLQFRRVQQMLNWLIDGVNRHCLPFYLWKHITPEWVEENYNVNYFDKI